MNNRAPHVWEIWHARFNYSEGKGYKYRPVIVIDVHRSGLLIMMVTSATNKLHLEHDYLIRNWKEAGLDKESLKSHPDTSAQPAILEPYLKMILMLLL